MAEVFIEKRVRFPRGAQKAFLQHCRKTLRLASRDLAVLLKISVRTLTDWQREKFLMPFSAAATLAQKTNHPLAKNIEVLAPYWYAVKGARKGGFAMYRKHGRVGGDPMHRRQKWYEWWEREGKTKPHPILNAAIPIRKPGKSTELAEFTGVMLGDGGLSKYQLRITLNYFDDKAYGKFVVKLIQKLFMVKPALYNEIKNSAFDISVSRRELVKFCVKELGLKIGNKIKQQADMPNWIKQSRKFQTACVRGLVDTDGSIFTHRYKVNGKWYRYKKLDFSSSSEPLRKSVYNALSSIGLNPRLTRPKNIRLDSKEDMRKYFLLVGSHNPKHLMRYTN